ncbi:MAG: copper chaperone PCu(A)C [Betaproteobacteria bacterium]
MKAILMSCNAVLASLMVAWMLGAHAHAADDVAVTGAWARASAPGQRTASVYLDIVSTHPAALTGASSPVAKRVEMHASSTQDGVMRMRAVEKIELPAKKTVKLAPGGLHIMLVDIARPLRENERVPLELIVERPGGSRSSLKLQVEVRGAGAASHQHTH